MNNKQFNLGDLINVLNGVKDNLLPVRFDNTIHVPSGFCSWRGDYSKLSLNYDGEYGGYAGEARGKLDTKEVLGYDYPQYDDIPAKLPGIPSAADLLDLACEIDGKMFEGWKGGWFTMGRSTPIFIANAGLTSGFIEYGYPDYQGVIGITECDDFIELNTGPVSY